MNLFIYKEPRSMQLFLIMLFSAFALESFSQTDVTSIYLTNADFNTNCNYTTGTSGTVATADPANTSTIEGWTLTSAQAWSAAATFEHGWNGSFNGVTTPTSGADGAFGTGQGAIGLTAGWSGSLIYSQQVTLDPGLYTFEFATAFLGQNNIAENLTGWLGDDGYVVLSNANSVQALGYWYTLQLSIRIVSQTTGKIQVGMKPHQSGSTSNARVFIDYVKIISQPVNKDALQALVNTANSMLANPEEVPAGSTVYQDLQSAVSNAQEVLDNGAATTSAILKAEDDMNKAIDDVEAAIFEASQTIFDNYTATYTSLTDINMKLTGKGQVTLTSSSDPIVNSAIDLASPDAWVYFENLKPSQVATSYLNYFKVNGQDAAVGNNIRITNYLNGAMVIAHSNNYNALTVFDGAAQGGTSRNLSINQHYKTAELGAMADNIESFILKRGYMATFASNENGTGTSRVYIADDDDVIVDVMPEGLSNTVSMVVVRQWRWTTKKGWRGSASGADQFNAGSSYDYNNSNYGTLDVEYVPMRHNPNWNAYSNFMDKFGSTHALGYNEPDNSVDDGFSSVADAINAWPNMMASGLRLGSPAPTDGGLNWLYSFMDQCDELGYRVDFVAWHFYRANNTAQQLYDQLLAIHNRTGRPIWITEFNNGCNWTYNGNEPTQEENAQVIQDFINMLEDAPFVERYYVWDGCNESLRMTNYDGSLKPAGIIYRDLESTMAFGEDFYNDCEQPVITPYVQVNNGEWTTNTDLTVNPGDQVRFGPQPFGGTWSWSGCGISGSSREQVIYPTDPCTVTATNTSICGAKSTVVYKINGGTLSTDQVENNIGIYPNPANNFINIVLKGNYDDTNVILFDLTGKIVLKTNLIKDENKIDLSHLSSGMYVVKIKNQNQSFSVKKIIKL
ncbi:glycosyl hydrolase [Aestuariibaculum sediminum]|uniref:T9SS type A sorting domain-containing protein n=1 Tax=Aestuariibaculum sediminum TaxID=2770637 RepID=A0A8J6Q245_9FLAO|nr:glycosyl hydrolase [Aestuariibaculum sediminum]MBD0831550.1 T9SS type A sorting domain-containing protein [Aestuariibaculum sediminum]